MIIAQQDSATLRHATDADLAVIDDLTILCYGSIQASYESMLGVDCYEAVRNDPHLTWQERKCGQVHRLYQANPQHVWVLEEADEVFGYISFYIVPAKEYGGIDNNAVHPSRQGKGWGKVMYRHVLD